MNFFLIDDDHEDQEIFKIALNEIDKSYECIVARDPIEAMSILNNNINLNADLIFLDLNMPRMNGKEGIREIKKDPRMQQTPVYFYSTHNDEKDVAEVKQLGAAGFIKKPSSINELSQILKKIIDTHLKPMQ
ncbi:MAG: response regulator [Bacteroidota bacterium]